MKIDHIDILFFACFVNSVISQTNTMYICPVEHCMINVEIFYAPFDA